jgi:hypothetical protein
VEDIKPRDSVAPTIFQKDQRAETRKWDFGGS